MQSAIYALRIIFRLATYRRRLKDLFANNDDRELWWLTGLVGFLTAVWLVAFLQAVSDNLFNASLVPVSWIYGPGFAAAWALALCGLRQKSGFEGRYLTPADDLPPAAAKYRKSAMTSEQGQRVAARLDAAMRNDRLFFDPALSLPKLAAHLAISPNVISQTLNETLGENFFEYVNRWRVDAAKSMIIDGEKTVLDIALEVGFNSKSAFYKAFKTATGTTPLQYKQQP